jgi:hypothetical protein
MINRLYHPHLTWFYSSSSTRHPDHLITRPSVDLISFYSCLIYFHLACLHTVSRIKLLVRPQFSHHMQVCSVLSEGRKCLTNLTQL